MSQVRLNSAQWLGGESVVDGQQTHGRTDSLKNNVAIAHPYYEGKFG